MKTFTYALVAVAAMVLATAPAMADQSSSAACHVLVNVDPNVAVNPDVDQVVVNAIQTGQFDVQCVFNIESNSQLLDLSVQASNLYKHDDVSSPHVINLKSGSETVEVVVANGSPLGGANNLLTFTGPAPSPIEAAGRSYPAMTTDTKRYGSGQGPYWQQQATVTVQYEQLINTLPEGQYSGAIQLTAMTAP